MKVTTATILLGAMISLTNSAFAGQVPDGAYSGTWHRTKDGSTAATCTYTFSANVLVAWSCGRNSGTVNIRAQRGVYAFNPVHDKDGKLTGQHELRWSGRTLEGQFVGADGRVKTEGKLTQ